MQADSPTASAARLTTTSYTPPGNGDASAPPAPNISGAASPGSHGSTAYITGAYMPSGNAMIDKMLELERALKHFGSPL